jgi:hypothetical protein
MAPHATDMTCPRSGDGHGHVHLASFSRPGHRKGLGMPNSMDRRGKEEETGTRAQSGSCGRSSGRLECHVLKSIPTTLSSRCSIRRSRQDAPTTYGPVYAEWFCFGTGSCSSTSRAVMPANMWTSLGKFAIRCVLRGILLAALVATKVAPRSMNRVQASSSACVVRSLPCSNLCCYDCYMAQGWHAWPLEGPTCRPSSRLRVSAALGSGAMRDGDTLRHVVPALIIT